MNHVKILRSKKASFSKDATLPSNEGMKDMIYKPPQQQSVPDIETDLFDDKPLEFNYFMSSFEELVERKIEDQRGRVTRLINFKTGEAKEAVSIVSDKQRSCTKMRTL